MVLFNPLSVDWRDHDAMAGSGLILLAALCWAANILYVRAHTWISTPFQLAFWQTLLATVVLRAGADRGRHAADRMDGTLVACFLYSGVFGIALGYWAMAMVNRSLPATTTSLGILATPVVGVICSTLALGETIDASLVIAMVMILSGIALGTITMTKSEDAAGP